MSYTIAVVDEGLLSLTRFRTPNPWNSFYAKEALGVKTWDVYDQVLGAFGGELERILSVGGDGEVNPDAVDQRANRFKPVVVHLGPFELEKGKTAKHNIQLPNYVGAVRTMVVAANNGAYGNIDKTTPVRKPLMVLATLPRVIGPTEEVKLPVNVFAMEDKVKNVTVTLKDLSNMATITGNGAQTIKFSQPGEQLVTFDLKMKERIGVARFQVIAEGAGEKATQEIEIQVRNPNPIVTSSYKEVLTPGQDWEQAFESLGMPGTNEAILEVSNIPPINLGEKLNYLIQYPYGCIEQTTSSGFPQLYVSRILELDNNQQKEIPANIRATLKRLNQFQTSQGGFGYWPGDDEASDWGSTYAGHFMLEAKSLGYTLPPGMLNRWIAYQQRMAKNWNFNESYGYYGRRGWELSQAYRLYTLALAGSPDLAAMNRLREAGKLQNTTSWRLAAAYALAGQTEIGKKLIENLTIEVPDYTELAYTYGSSLRDRGMILETLVLLGEDTKAAELIQYISDQLDSGRWYGTQTIAYCLLAVGKYIGDGGVGKSFAFAFQQGNGAVVNVGSEKPLMQILLDEDKARSVKISNSSNTKLFARLVVSGQPLIGKETAQSNDLNLEIVYKAINGKVLDPAALAQGTDFIAEVSITNPGSRGIPYEEMAIHQIFPSGWEILNTRMDGVQNFKEANTPEYQDFRDDRVYTFFDINANTKQIYRIQLNAAYQGRFYMPAVSCEAMYDKTINARTAGQWVEVKGISGS